MCLGFINEVICSIFSKFKTLNAKNLIKLLGNNGLTELTHFLDDGGSLSSSVRNPIQLNRKQAFNLCKVVLKYLGP